MSAFRWTILLLLVGCGSNPAVIDLDTETPPADGCTEAKTAVTQATFGKTVDGLNRRFRLTKPAAEAGVAMPMMMAFHGGGGADYEFPQQAAFDQLAESEGVIMVYPVAELVSPNEGEWQLNTTASTIQDIHFIEEIIDAVSSRFCVDQNRIYGTGYSLGSMFNYELACQMNNRFAALASFAGTMPVQPASCELVENIAIMHIHSQDDEIIPYSNGWDWKAWDSVGPMMDIPNLVDFWSNNNNCAAVNEETTGSGLHVTHDGCDGGVRVEHHRLSSGGHAWPSRIDGTSTHQVIWDFVSQFNKP